MVRESIPTIAEWAEYGVSPGVLVGIIVIGCGFTVWLIVKLTMYFVEWHTTQMDSIRIAHATDREKYITKLDEIKDEIVLVSRAIERSK